MQLLLFRGQAIDIEIIAMRRVARNRGRGFFIVYRLVAEFVRAFRRFRKVCAFVLQFFDMCFGPMRWLLDHGRFRSHFWCHGGRVTGHDCRNGRRRRRNGGGARARKLHGLRGDDRSVG
jgi:hypothetical protein